MPATGHLPAAKALKDFITGRIPLWSLYSEKVIGTQPEKAAGQAAIAIENAAKDAGTGHRVSIRRRPSGRLLTDPVVENFDE
jgi:hypothetical protein